MKTVKTLNSITRHCSDSVQVTIRHAVYENTLRIGTVYEIRVGDKVWFEPRPGKNGDGKPIIINYIRQQKKTLNEAIAAI